MRQRKELIVKREQLFFAIGDVGWHFLAKVLGYDLSRKYLIPRFQQAQLVPRLDALVHWQGDVVRAVSSASRYRLA